MAVVIKHIYVIPEFSDALIDDITNDKDIIYNKNYKLETYKAQALFYIKLTHAERAVTLYAFGYKPDGYKNMDSLGNMYFVCNEWFIMSGFSPFTQAQFYNLMTIMYNFCPC